MKDQAAKNTWFYLKACAIGLCLFIYVVLGLYTEFKLIGIKPLPAKLIEDANYYRRAYRDAQAGTDPYAVWDIGVGYLYPPPALLIIGLFATIEPFLLSASLLTATNILLLSLIMYGVARKYGYSLSDVWWWFPLGLGFAPFLEVLHVGQINVITQFGVFCMFALAESAPALGGAGLALGIVTKVTPLAFAGYLLARRNLRAIAGTIGGLLVLSLLAGLVFGFQPFVTYIDVLQRLLGVFPLDPNSQSLAAVLQGHGLIAAASAPAIHRALTIYLLLVFASSAIGAYLSREHEPLFIVLSLGLALMPNVMWYHHYVFLLLPVFVWLAWSRMHPAVTLWCFAGLALIQVDRQYSFFEIARGALAHGFGHLSILAILGWQMRRVYAILKDRPNLASLLLQK